MDDYEVVRRTDAAVQKFAGRIPDESMPGIRELAEVGEQGEAVSNLLASLVTSGAAVTAAERDELRALADATGEGTEYVGQLVVSG